MKPGTRVGCDFAHAIVDDHTRLAYVELHDDEKAPTVTPIRAVNLLGRTARRRGSGRGDRDTLAVQIRQVGFFWPGMYVDRAVPPQPGPPRRPRMRAATVAVPGESVPLRERRPCHCKPLASKIDASVKMGRMN